MTASGPKSLPAIGFLTVMDRQSQGLFGGYLILNAQGRPLEFHCTAPVRPNRAQQILYGPTLTPYLYGEQIGRTLLDKAKVEPRFVCTDVEPALAVRPFVQLPVLLTELDNLSTVSQHETTTIERRIDDRHQSIPSPTSGSLLRFILSDQSLAVSSEFAQDQEIATRQWNEHFAGLDLAEPFARIREAIEEAQRSNR